ncbi:protein spaetzle-like [Zeugodacus cucurbitae]|uniref:protein spaetzle-like n=1 Tax=Zeugodacus cucurbitae TaxID=28588 RepID=UPI0023D94637|nr:protein spaetzle-like [Zeugodacus cucurbitae]
MTLKLHFLLKMLAFFMLILQTTARPMPNADMMNKLKSIFKVGDGIMVYNTGTSNEALEDDEIVCAERRAGKSYCKEVENYMEATRLDLIDPEQFEKFRAYFTDDMAMPQNIATRMEIDAAEKPSSIKTNVIYPEGVLSEDSSWLLVVQHEQHKQGILVEECETVDSATEENSTLPMENNSKCKQNFNYRKLVVLVNGVMKEEMVKLPSTCECDM